MMVSPVTVRGWTQKGLLQAEVNARAALLRDLRQAVAAMAFPGDLFGRPVRA
jgi:hypothetical protein